MYTYVCMYVCILCIHIHTYLKYECPCGCVQLTEKDMLGTSLRVPLCMYVCMYVCMYKVITLGVFEYFFITLLVFSCLFRF